jgi:hypothetical protein
MISHPKYNALFIAISKTASSAIRNRLRRLGVAPPKWKVPDYVDYKHTQHLNIHEYRQILGQEDLDARFKFVIVKNPFHRLVSSYTGICRNIKNNTCPKQGLHDPRHFHKWVKETAFNKQKYDDYLCPRLGPKCFHHRATYDSQLSWITDEKGKLLVDFIGRYENIEADFRTILTKINEIHPLPVERRMSWSLPVSNVSNRGHHYSFYYDGNDEIIEMVREHCKEDIEEFGYEYEVE